MITLLKYTKESTRISDIQRLLLRVQFKLSCVKHTKAFTFQTSVKAAFFNFFFNFTFFYCFVLKEHCSLYSRLYRKVITLQMRS